MSQALCFNDVQFEIISRNGQPWITARQLSQALGYAREDSVLKIYERNKEEFSSMMSATVKMTVGLTEVVARIFSMRGCHLVGMLSRTPVAKAFRRWVLDVLDRLAAEERAALPEAPHIKITPSTTASRKPLRALVHAWAQVSGTPHTALWPQVKAHFQLERIDDLPEEWIPDALEWVQGKIDSLTPAHRQGILDSCPAHGSPLPRGLPRRHGCRAQGCAAQNPLHHGFHAGHAKCCKPVPLSATGQHGQPALRAPRA